jgi:DNA repair exonuclease SbcCD ATPase subunit
MMSLAGGIRQEPTPGVLKKIFDAVNFIEAKQRKLRAARAEAQAKIDGKKRELEEKRSKMENQFNEERDRLGAEMNAEVEKQRAECEARGDKFKGQGMEEFQRKKMALEKAHQKLERGLDDAESALSFEKPWMDPDDDIILLHAKILNEDNSESEDDGSEALHLQKEREHTAAIAELEEEINTEYARKQAEYAARGIEFRGQGMEELEKQRTRLEKQYRQRQRQQQMVHIGVGKAAQQQLAFDNSTSQEEEEYYKGVSHHQWQFKETDFIVNVQFMLRKIYFRQNMVRHCCQEA